MSHWHKPAGPENFVAPARARLLLRVEKSEAVKHQCPLALLGHEHVMRGRVGLGGGPGRGMSKDFRDEARGIASVHAGMDIVMCRCFKAFPACRFGGDGNGIFAT